MPKDNEVFSLHVNICYNTPRKILVQMSKLRQPNARGTTALLYARPVASSGALYDHHNQL